jgi:hypothetical protein
LFDEYHPQNSQQIKKGVNQGTWYLQFRRKNARKAHASVPLTFSVTMCTCREKKKSDLPKWRGGGGGGVEGGAG